MVHIASSERRVVTTKQKNRSTCFKSISANQNQPHPNLDRIRQKSSLFWHNRIELPLVHSIDQSLFSSLIVYNSNLLLSSMILSLSNEGIQWSLDCNRLYCFDCKRSRPRIDTGLPRNSPASLELVVSKTTLSENHLLRVPITPNQH